MSRRKALTSETCNATFTSITRQVAVKISQCNSAFPRISSVNCFVLFFPQELQDEFETKTPVIESACEKGKLLIMMESYSQENKVEVDKEVQSLKEKWDLLRSRLTNTIEQMETKSEEFEQLETEIHGVSEKLNELQNSTEDMKSISLVNGKVENLRESYEVL